MDQNTSACMWPVSGVLMVDLVIEIIPHSQSATITSSGYRVL